ncbi:MAG: endonuclease/exonuclease/phosphatase family protein [Gammaproteobacteria bacterium]|nr:endonuclease/exonuclease/phosphatase family protein [Gammaproteobacteria bacterium]
MSDDTIKIVTYNIHKGFSTTNKHFVLHDIKSALQDVAADIVFLQEIQGEHQLKSSSVLNWPSEPQFEFLADQVWPHHAYGKNAIYQSGHHGNAILSKHPFQQWENINVSNMKSASRSLLHGVIQLPNSTKSLHVICVHLGLFEKERSRQFDTLCQRIDSHIPHTDPLIIAGDFNDFWHKSEQHLHDHLDLTEVFKQLTGSHARSFPAWFPVMHTDRIYYRGITPYNCERLKHKPWKRLSDHIPLMAEFKL